MSPAGSDLVVLIPALSRPQNVAPVFSSIVATAPAARVLFLCDPGDEAQIEAVRRTDADLDLDGGNYAAKINRGIRLTGEPLIFTGADDLHFRDGWLDACRQRLDRAEVIGTQDLCNQRTMRGEHSTHFLVTRDYAERGQIDGEPGLLCEGYAHNCVDDELIATATARGVYAFADDAIVEHHHPLNGTAPLDPTYVKGTALIRQDRRLFRIRRHLWAK